MRTKHPVLRRDTSRRQSRIEHFRRCLRSVCDAGSDGECLEGRCPRREPRTAWRAKPLFDRRLECVDERATYEPAILKQVAAAGHAIGSHTWCHQDLSKTKGTCLVNGKRESVEYDPKDEIEKGISAVHWAVGGPTAPYFRFPALKQPPELIE